MGSEIIKTVGIFHVYKMHFWKVKKHSFWYVSSGNRTRYHNVRAYAIMAQRAHKIGDLATKTSRSLVVSGLVAREKIPVK